MKTPAAIFYEILSFRDTRPAGHLHRGSGEESKLCSSLRNTILKWVKEDNPATKVGGPGVPATDLADNCKDVGSRR